MKGGMRMFAWSISLAATILGFTGLWLYGNRSWRGALWLLAACSVWLFYDVYFRQYPLLVFTIPNFCIHSRNLWKMKKETSHEKHKAEDDTHDHVFDAEPARMAG